MTWSIFEVPMQVSVVVCVCGRTGAGVGVYELYSEFTVGVVV